ncbi:sugar ABC transporter substrate-binding protein [Litchfieldia salsa]|uniref:Simple sugar transport system substrate-binding protein/D-xylose transport system substrate-binding protein n=1 Tax=Litchfieldia salsa TaxID=930152 RepID=A0A1H0PU54_9BACI|nr:substrate-binding domain-containing protein [Litchfieldia salsa]SDP08340.1 simple sugar transport system substrate-binding protein/D-xylose transport system substrate-binding protein [Litchfieldia salsa]
MKKKIVMICLLALSLLVAACSNKEAEIEQQSSKQKLTSDPDKIYVGFALDTLQQERWYKDKEHFEKTVQELGGNVKTLAANGDAEVQIRQAELLIKEGVDVLVVVPSDSIAAGKIVELAHAANVKVISYDKLILNANVDYYVSFDNVKVGELQAQYVVNEVKQGNIAYVGGDNSDNNAKLVKEGSFSVLQPLIDNGSLKVVYDQQTDGWSGDVAKEQITQYLKSGGVKFDGIVTGYDGLAEGALEAVGNLAGTIPVTGQDAELGALQRIVTGTQTMTVYKPIPLIAKSAATLAMEVGKGTSPSTDIAINNGNLDVPSILLEPVAVTKDNIEETVVKDGHLTKEAIYEGK